MSYTCNNLASFFEPVHAAAITLADAGTPIQMTIGNKVCGDPAYADDRRSTQLTIEILAEYGNVTCADGSYSTGILYGQLIEIVAAIGGGHAGWAQPGQPDGCRRGTPTSPTTTSSAGSTRTDGVNDAYFSEAAQVKAIVESAEVR